MSNFIANWPAPASISALTTTRLGGFSQPPFDSNNFGLHVGDDENSVCQNRLRLKESLLLPNEPAWLEQTHSSDCVVVEDDSNRVADAAITRSKTTPLVIMTADCLPVLLCDRNGTEVAAIHSGWRGLANGIVENTLAKMHSAPESLMAWIGPAICGTCYEIGEEVRQAYISRYPFTANTFRQQGTSLFANLPQMAELILNAQGVQAVYQSGACTFELTNTFYSYRSKAKTGRMASLIWFGNTTGREI